MQRSVEKKEDPRPARVPAGGSPASACLPASCSRASPCHRSWWAGRQRGVIPKPPVSGKMSEKSPLRRRKSTAVEASSVTNNSAGARPRETGPRGFSNRTQISADLADQHGFPGVSLKGRQRRDPIDSGAQGVDTQDTNQRKSVPSVVIRVPFESLREPLERGSRDVCQRQRRSLVRVPGRGRQRLAAVPVDEKPDPQTEIVIEDLCNLHRTCKNDATTVCALRIMHTVNRRQRNDNDSNGRFRAAI